MLHGIYTPLSGALAQERVLEVIANNLANVNTNAFKGDNISFKLLESEPERNYASPLPPANFKVDLQEYKPFRGNEIAFVGIADIDRDVSQGPAVETKDPTDFMIDGEGLFAVQTEDGVRYTRSGDFKISTDGVLMTSSGHPVMGERGNIFVRSNSFEVNPRGEIYQDGELVDRVKVFEFADQKQLERTGDNYFFFGGPDSERTVAENSTVRQGYLEGSNVNAMKNLAAMIIAHRSYEAYQKAISNYDKMLEKGSNSIGEVRA
jgi:flagellar basal-body rod protein FlgF